MYKPLCRECFNDEDLTKELRESSKMEDSTTLTMERKVDGDAVMQTDTTEAIS